MSISAYANLRVGIPVTKEDFWKVVAKRWRCRNKHPVDDGNKYCPKCGSTASWHEELEATPEFKQWSEAESDSSAGIMYDRLRNNEQICSAKPIQSSEDVWGANDLILCVPLRSIGEYSDDSKPVSFAELNKAQAELASIAAHLGIADREVKLYCSLYWSC